MKGFIPDIMRILQQYNLSDEFRTYMFGEHFPAKGEWKALTRLSVMKLDIEDARNVLRIKSDNARCVRLLYDDDGEEMSIHIFHRIIKSSDSRISVKPLIRALTLLALPETSYTDTKCTLCKQVYTDIVCHIITQCPLLNEERNTLWEFVIDSVDVETSVRLFHLADETFVDWLFGGLRNLSGRRDIQIIYPELSRLILRLFYKQVKMNYKWLK